MAGNKSFVEMIGEGSMSTGMVFLSGSPNLAEAVCQTPLDFLMLDCQHGTPNLETLENIIRAVELHDMPVIVRVPRDDTSLVTNLLDMGAQGIMLPQVEGPAVIREVLSHVRYEDGRSFASLTRAGDFGECTQEEYVEHVNSELAIVPQIESREGVRNVDRIAEEPGVSAVAVGPADLSLNMDVSNDSEEFAEAVDTVFEAGRAHGRGIGTFVGSPTGLREYTNRTTFTVYGSDIRLLPAHLDSALADQ